MAFGALVFVLGAGAAAGGAAVAAGEAVAGLAAAGVDTTGAPDATPDGALGRAGAAATVDDDDEDAALEAGAAGLTVPGALEAARADVPFEGGPVGPGSPAVRGPDAVIDAAGALDALVAAAAAAVDAVAGAGEP